MELNENKRITKTMIQDAKRKREEMFQEMSDQEILAYVPTNKGYFYEYERRFDIGIFIPQCCLCGALHKHGKGEYNGTRITMCKLKGLVGSNEVIPHNYRINIDWDDLDNIRLANKYGIKIPVEVDKKEANNERDTLC
ncbi:hypothetical protein D0439_04320 [Lysinibacillus fusiformis]|uniref:hypothetical protein n=1 Tax=Lysinibacillus fusiformis TaxID=28031 RepID=UPI0011BBD158|nr:hypothetical protein [Lysinibacillus fusiformis]QDZ97892.1 hypothetical protein D0439_04320 [Lysinibacillus fusiformis]